MLILGIDPGTRESGWCIYDTDKRRPALNGAGGPYSGDIPNDVIVDGMYESLEICDVIVIERPTLYGKGGESLVETIIWAGRFFQAAGPQARFMTRGQVCEYWGVNGLGKGKDAIINSMLNDRFGGIDGRKAAVGTKSKPGPLFGITGDARQALALAIAYAETKIVKGEEF